MTKFQKVLSGLTLLFITASANAVIVELVIEFDDFPNETAFGMWDAGSAPSGAAYAADPFLAFDGIAYDVGASSPIGFGDGYVLPGDFTGEPANVPFSFVWDLAVGNYTFIIIDTFGDGICCGWGEGSYSLSVDGDIVASSEGVFEQFEVTTFAAVPEPGFLALFALGLLGVGASQARRRKV